ncbi:MAG: right-handed parallel beta-helix repeat-containing protein [Lacisediminihabitans sp.]
MVRSPKHQAVSTSHPKKWRTPLSVGVILAVCSTLVVSAYVTSAAAGESGWSVDHPIASDTLNRAVAAGWGSAQLGGAYSYSQTQQFSADGSEGVATLARPGSSATASLTSVSTLDAVANISIAVPKLPMGGNGIYTGLQLRRAAGNYYQAQLRTAATGRVMLSLLRVNGSTANQTVLRQELPVITAVTAGQKFTLEFQVTGQSPVELRARAWLNGNTKPGWQSAAHDSSDSRLRQAGGLGVWTYLSRGSTARVAAYDELKAFSLVRARASASEPVPTPGESPTPAPGQGVPSPAAPELPVGAGAADAGAIVDSTAARGPVGAAEIGSASYGIPTGAVFVASDGPKDGRGTLASPFSSIQDAIDAAVSPSTIVIRGGSYDESVVIPQGKALALQPYPKEAVWLDGSRAVSPWTSAAASGTAWSTPWSVAFDSSPTYTRGAPDGTDLGWSFVNPKHPLAAHPDQVWLDGAALTQVGSAAQLVAGSFFVDPDSRRLILGSDPHGHEVRASDSVKAVTVLGAGSAIKGIGIRRFAPSVPDMGAVVVLAKNVTLENLSITDNATTGLSVDASGATLKGLTVARNGMLGIHADFADGLTASNLLVADNNTEQFNRAPVAGGMKMTRSRHVSVSSSAFLRNAGNALWFDESVYDGTAISNDIVGNSGNALVVELSSLFTLANNIVANNGIAGILIGDSNQTTIWNNTVTGNNRDINIVQGDRRASNLSVPGHDPRQTLPDPTVTWITGQVTIKNNILANSTGNCVLCVEDYSHQRSAHQMGIESSGNVFQRASTAKPSWIVVWSRGEGNPAVYTDLSDYVAATGQDRQSLSIDSGQALTGIATPLAAVTTATSRLAQPLPASIAAMLGKPAGSRALGAWPR